jgi:tRNA A-37 threonylcarbamoyl transferase component Bud32
MLGNDATDDAQDAAKPESARNTLRGAQSPGPPSPQELAGHFPHLDILELLGQGGMGYVYKARQKGLDRLVALKLLPQEVSTDRNFAERFAREARALARLSHPGIVMVHDSGQVGGHYYFIMEFVDGLNLRELLGRSDGRVESEQALQIVGSVCDALEYAHDEGVVHRDIKPENILLDMKGRVKIADFGLAKLLGADVGSRTNLTLASPHRMLGTPHYMAPEQTERPLEVDHRADIYSLGVVFYEMLTGELPLGRFPLPSERGHGDPRLDDIVVRALEKDPGRRFQRASDIKTAVASAVAGTPPVAPPVAPAAGSVEAATALTPRPGMPGSAVSIPSGMHVVEMSETLRRVRKPSIALIVVGVISLISVVFTIPTGAVLVVGGIMMMRLRWRSLVLIACIVSIVPHTPAWFVTMPIGIWCLVVANRSDVAAAFRAVAAERAATRRGEGSP